MSIAVAGASAKFAGSPRSVAGTHYLPVLDGLRAISVLLVVFSHAGWSQLIPGGLGVLCFFVISGYLLTSLMLEEVDRTATLSIRRFYLRRFLRLAPALVVYVIGANLLTWRLGADVRPLGIMSAIFYFANYYEIYVQFGHGDPNPILWSLAVEEHFYLLFPWVVWAFRRNPRRLLPCLVVAACVTLGWRIVLDAACSPLGSGGMCGGNVTDRIYHGSDTMIDTILFGAILAGALRFHAHAARRWIINQPAFIAACVALLVCLLYRDPHFRNTIRYTIQSASFAVVIANLLLEPRFSLGRLLGSVPMVAIGRLSYSLYLFHFAVLDTMLLTGIGAPNSSAGRLFLYLATSFSLAGASYLVIERPFVRLRRRFGSHAA